MPGGSVNGRPFRESNDSYSRTGIPCGNPKRYNSRDVLQMDLGQRGRKRSLMAPVEEIETEGKKQLQALVQKQLKTKVDLAEIKKKKEFAASDAKFNPATEKLSGIVSLKDYQDLEKSDDYIQELKQCGLTDEEIMLKLENQNDYNLLKSVKRSRYGMDPVSYQGKMEEIQKKIQSRQTRLSLPDPVSGMKLLSRSEMELENSIAFGNEKNKFLHKALIQQKTSTLSVDPKDPMCQLPEILKSLTKNSSKKASSESLSSNSNRAKQLMDSAEVNGQGNSHETVPFTEQPVHVFSFKDDCLITITEANFQDDYSSNQGRVSKIADINDEENEEIKCCDAKELKATCTVDVRNADNFESEEKERTLKKPRDDQAPRELVARIEPIPVDVIQKYRLSNDEIRKIPKFENYTPGAQNKVLYLKNLAPKVTEEDLVSLFIRFQKESCPKIVFRLLTGRMKGQAFVTFDSPETAKEALELVNGYQLKGRPIIVEYGKQKSS
ncbi:hypothetical protein CHS0354_026283 [Potamilus streckersoni]|uniref:RNA-binding protein 41 n=1 Tax=Potamilus streckersoni TaxID=2493646 RepID=A0AAE0WCA1_9BIVA|nr:hypothetical protein CHS0354_026283 [Potamilus streckersoni]